VDTSGALIATKIERDDDESENDEEDEKEVEIEGAISEIGPNSLIVVGRTILFDANTEFELDDDDITVSEFLAALNVGDIVEIEGFDYGNGNIIAQEIELEEDD